MGQHRCYLLFAGTRQPPRGGLGDLLGTFTSEQGARDAFREIRLQPPSPASWAQLAVVDPEDGIKPLCWFGIGAKPEGNRRPHGLPVGKATTVVQLLAVRRRSHLRHRPR